MSPSQMLGGRQISLHKNMITRVILLVLRKKPFHEFDTNLKLPLDFLLYHLLGVLGNTTIGHKELFDGIVFHLKTVKTGVVTSNTINT